MAIKFLVDSSSDITESLANELGVTMLAMPIAFGEEEYADGITLYGDLFYDKLLSSPHHPKTSQITAFRYQEAFEELTKDGSEVIALTLSSALSKTYENALLASKEFEGKVYVVDTLNAISSIRMLLEHAMKLANEGKTAKEIVKVLDEIKGRIRVLAYIDTLEYLKKGGRISAATAFIGSALAIKPLIAVVDGKIEMIGKAVGVKRAEMTLSNMINGSNGIDFNLPYCAIYSGKDKTNIEKFVQSNKDFFQGHDQDLRYLQIGSTVGVHIGCGAVGLVYFEKE